MCVCVTHEVVRQCGAEWWICSSPTESSPRLCFAIYFDEMEMHFTCVLISLLSFKVSEKFSVAQICQDTKVCNQKWIWTFLIWITNWSELPLILILLSTIILFNLFNVCKYGFSWIRLCFMESKCGSVVSLRYSVRLYDYHVVIMSCVWSCLISWWSFG